MKKITSKLAKEILTLLKKGGKYSATNIEMRSFANSSRQKVDCVKCDLEINGRCQFPVVDVKFVEMIDIRILNEEPHIYVRDDFPIVPHLMTDGKSKWLCLSEQPFEDYRHKVNGRYILECIINWLEKTAKGELHRDDQALEPFFFGTQNIIVFSPQQENSALFSSFSEKKNGNARILVEEASGAKCYASLAITTKPESANVIHDKPKSLKELVNYFPNENILERYKELLFKILDVANKDGVDTSNCGVILKLNVPLIRASGNGENGNDYKIFVVDTTLQAVCANLNSGKEWYDLSGQLFTPHIKFNRNSAQWLNNMKTYTNLNSIRVTMVGGGAVGSYLFEYFLRSGYGNWIIIDNDKFYAHNSARHTLVSKDLGINKVDALADKAKSVISDFEVKAIPKNAFSPDADVATAYLNADILIDASASSAVERHLARDVKTHARRISCFLNPRGTSAIFFMEDEQTTCRLDLLEMQYYRILTEHLKYLKHLQPPEDMAYAPTCRSVTSQLPVDSVALSTALFSKAIKSGLTDRQPKLIIWNFENEQIHTDNILPDNWKTRHSTDDKWVVEINEILLRDIRVQEKRARPNETGEY